MDGNIWGNGQNQLQEKNLIKLHTALYFLFLIDSGCAEISHPNIQNFKSEIQNSMEGKPKKSCGQFTK